VLRAAARPVRSSNIRRLLNFREAAICEIEKSGPGLRGIVRFDLDVVLVEQVRDAFLAIRDVLFEFAGNLGRWRERRR
jgi:hypothetical protein